MLDKLKYSEEEEGLIPWQHRILFENDDDTRLTETPSNMIIPLTRLEIWAAAADPDRTEPLSEFFIKRYNARMISRDRKGRIEAVEIIHGISKLEEERDGLSL